ncbi:hypothetical protein SVAN01_03280 [Stagonosporopsis vannaccii]|nr:hypothetical protein SVAN01_03280 [Stagonosporopsis vannaccii]
MPPKHIAQTSTEVKKAYKQNGSAISDRTHKQLQRGYELEQRAAREREAEQRRKLAKEKRIEREKKEDQIRKQIGVSLATQLIGYSHTQAHLKKGMETFLGINKKRQEEERRRKEEEKRREEELARKLELIAQDIDKEPFDDDDDIDDAMLDLPVAKGQEGGGWVDEELDDDTLLEVHDLVMSDPIEGPADEPIRTPPRSATAPPAPHKPTPSETAHSADVPPAQDLRSDPPKQDTMKEDLDFTRTHGPVNKAVESALAQMPGEIIELLSHDTAISTSDWAPSHGLLYKLNPIGLPPHRLRVKVGCVVVCLRDLNTSSQLSKSQHVRILRVENERLECLTLDGQLAGTKTVITRVPFPARYRNDDQCPFTRVQYPVRVATDYISTDFPKDTQSSGFKLPSINGRVPRPTIVKKHTPPASKPQSLASSNPSFKLPGLPASRVRVPYPSKSAAPLQTDLPTSIASDGWDDFLESGTQIARELSAEVASNRLPTILTRSPPAYIESEPPLSTQDLDFSLDEIDEASPAEHVRTAHTEADREAAPSAVPAMKAASPNRASKPPPSVKPGPLSRTAYIRRIEPELDNIPNPIVRPQKSLPSKGKRPMAPALKHSFPSKKPCMAPRSQPTVISTNGTSRRLSNFDMSTQEASSFFDDDDDLVFGSPPIAV